MTSAVLDPGVLVSAVITPHGTCAGLLRAWREGAFELVVSPALLAEFTDVLQRKKFARWVKPAEADEIAAMLAARAHLVDDPAEPERVCRDPGDDYLIALARAAEASVLVSGDGDLLALRIAPPVVSPATFLEALDAAGR